MIGITWSPSAVADLDRIAAWLDENRGLDMAAGTLETIGRRANFLTDFPHGGRPHKADMRVLVVSGTSYIIVYRYRATLVEIIRVHHARENWQVDL